jgi:hypothetical protein
MLCEGSSRTPSLAWRCIAEHGGEAPGGSRLRRVKPSMPGKCGTSNPSVSSHTRRGVQCVERPGIPHRPAPMRAPRVVRDPRANCSGTRDAVPLDCLARARQRPMPRHGLRYSGDSSPIPSSRGITVARPLRRCLANPSRPLHHPLLLHPHRLRTRPEPRPHIDRPMGPFP